MTAKLARNQNQLWTFSDAPPVPNRYPEVFQNFHIIKNVFTGESVQHNGDGSYAITAAGGTHVSAISLANNALQLFILRGSWFQTWYITYIDSSAEFILSYYTDRQYCIVNTSGILPSSGYTTANATRCILERVYDMDGSMCY